MNESYRAVVSGIDKFHADKLSLRLKPERPFTFQAGQYVELTLETCEPRYYSIASTPGSADIELHIKDNGNGGLGTYAMTKNCRWVIQRPSAARLAIAYGRTMASRTRFWLAGGIGIIPLKAIGETAIAASYAGRLSLYWGVQQQADLYLQSDELNLLAVKMAAQVQIGPLTAVQGTDENAAVKPHQPNCRIQCRRVAGQLKG